MPQARVRHAGLGRDSTAAARHRDSAATGSLLEPLPQHAAACGRFGGRGLGAADAGLGQHELDAARRLPVAGQRGDDRADLLVAGAQQEGRRAAVALHADHVDAGVGVRELVDAVRRHATRRSAGWGRSAVRARGRPRRGRRGRAAARRAASRSGRKPVAAITSSADDLALAVGEHEPSRRAVDTARVWKPAASATEPSATSSRTAEPSAPRAGSWSSPPPPYLRPGAPAADRPHDLGRGLGVAQRDQVEDRVERRVAAADDQHALAGVARAIARRARPGCRRRSGRRARAHPRPAARRRRAGSAASRCPRRRSPTPAR